MRTKSIVLLLALGGLRAFAGANVIYQATLLDGTNTVSGTFDMKFTLYAGTTGGEPLGVAYNQYISSRHERARFDLAPPPLVSFAQSRHRATQPQVRP